MDALIPFVRSLQEHRSEGAVAALREGVAAAENGYERTRHMSARLGRASYMDQDTLKNGEGIPDPGALGVVAVAKGILAALSESQKA